MTKKEPNRTTESEIASESKTKTPDTKVGGTKDVVRVEVQAVVTSSAEAQDAHLVDEYLSFLEGLKQSKANDKKQYINRRAELQEHPERVTCCIGDLNHFYYKLNRNKFYGRHPDESPMPGGDSDPRDPNFRGSNSAKFLNGTWNEFYDAIDTCIAEIGISRAQLEYMTTRTNFSSMESMNQELIALYLLLRKKGYSNRDLVGS